MYIYIWKKWYFSNKYIPDKLLVDAEGSLRCISNIEIQERIHRFEELFTQFLIDCSIARWTLVTGWVGFWTSETSPSICSMSSSNLCLSKGVSLWRRSWCNFSRKDSKTSESWTSVSADTLNFVSCIFILMKNIYYLLSSRNVEDCVSRHQQKNDLLAVTFGAAPWVGVYASM